MNRAPLDRLTDEQLAEVARCMDPQCVCEVVGDRIEFLGRRVAELEAIVKKHHAVFRVLMGDRRDDRQEREGTPK